MKKKNVSLLKFKKSKISNLYNLKKIVGGTGTDGALVTLHTDCVVSCVYTCETYDPEKCHPDTRTLADNTFYDPCDCDGFHTGVGC